MPFSNILLAGLGMLSVAGANLAAPHAADHWDYSGAQGPDRWHRVSPKFALCKAGREESPVPLDGAIPAELPPLHLATRKLEFRVRDTEHALQADVVGSAILVAGAQTYTLTQFHFHHPAEHYVGTPEIKGEVHLVHQLAGGRMGVIGIPIREGKANPAVQTVLDALAARQIAPVRLSLRDILPGRQSVQRDYFRYEGSLTTPPCSETVDWFVLAKPIEVSAAQMQRLASLHGRNARPLQALNRRFVLRSSH